MEECGEFLCPKCGRETVNGYSRWTKKNNQYTFSLFVRGIERWEERWANVENEEKKEKRLKSLQDAIDSINSQFMTLSASERAEDCEPYENEIEEVHNDYKTYYKDTPNDLTGYTIEAWDNFLEHNWRCYQCKFSSPTFLDFIPKNK